MSTSPGSIAQRQVVLTRTAGEFVELFAGRRPNALVMTMGALHAGHAALIRAARDYLGHGSGVVGVTIFVNPLQFGVGEDFDRYPRRLEADLRVAQEAGADVVFAPAQEELYPDGQPQVTISAGPMGGRFEGAFRPGHFDGVLTVVGKVLNLAGAPQAAFFGQKDAQQLALIRRMVADLNIPTEIRSVPTVREADGLALSSRNSYLSAKERTTALALSRALFAGRTALASKTAATGAAKAVREAAGAVLDAAARLEEPLALDYFALVNPADFTEVGDDYRGAAVLVVAGRVGTTRLIDNIPLDIGQDHAQP